MRARDNVPYFLVPARFRLGADPSGISGLATPLGVVLHPFKHLVHGPSVGTVTTCSREFSVLELHALLASQRMLSDWIQVLTGPEVQLGPGPL